MIQMTTGKRIVNPIVKAVSNLVCKVDDVEVDKVPFEGPLLIVVNHINFIEGPVLAPRLHPRLYSVLAKQESWDNPLFRFLFNTWDFIPLERGEADVGAIKKGLRVLEDKQLLGIFPEGTRTGDGRLIQAKSGTALVATHAETTILPLGCWGYEGFWDNLKKLKRTPFHIAVGNPFQIKPLDRRSNKELRQEVTDQIMYQLAGVLPEQYRGYYAENPREDLLVFPEGSSSNWQ